MYEVEDISESMNSQDEDAYGQWYSVIHNMNAYRVNSNCDGYTFFTQEMAYVNDEEMEDNLLKAVNNYLGR